MRNFSDKKVPKNLVGTKKLPTFASLLKRKAYRKRRKRLMHQAGKPPMLLTAGKTGSLKGQSIIGV